ncbi:MAG: YdcF family protein [Alphaproteobacteria bacterium]|nr:YdcF family protein [Alphaproteobacteria bacterium]MBR4806507.1 YdcF family protein [Alphaproteobacteria bacterium]
MKLFHPSFWLICLFVVGGIAFKLTRPNDCGFILQNDSIFVLTGDFRRIPFAMKQIEKYPDADLYIIGAGAESQYKNTNRATIESESKSTYQNAVAIRNIAEKSGLDRIVLITTEDHIRRAKYLVQSELPAATIVACPVALSNMPPSRRLERWFIEYVKYIATMLGIKESPHFLYR